MNLWSISHIFNSKVFRYNIQFLLPLSFFCIFFYTHFTLAEISVEDSDRVCTDVKDTENKENIFCFFSLNSPKEKEKLEDIYGNVKDVKVVEFYGTDNAGESVKERYKEMLRTQECDHVIHSGHSLGYVAGDLSINKNKDGKRNKDWKLDLNFLEDMSCEPGCEKWFSNVKSVFLMGCQTVKTDEEYDSEQSKKQYTDKFSPDGIRQKTPDSEHIRVGEKYDIKANYSHFLVNQAYSSALDKNDKLSHRFLKMYSNSSIYGWGDAAPGESAGSADSLPRFIEWVTAINSNLGKNKEAPKHLANSKFDPQNILNFIEYMNNQPHPVCREHTVGTLAWTRHWDKGTLPTACYLSGDQDFKKEIAEYHQQGCNLSRALGGKGEKTVENSVKEILDNTESIKANFNRLMSLVIDRRNHGKDWYESVMGQLRGSEKLRKVLNTQIQSNGVGFTRKSDYLYFYKQMGWTDSVNELSASFLDQLKSVFNKIPRDEKKPQFHQSFHLSVLNSIENNGLQAWLYKSGSEAERAFENFMGSVEAVYPDVTKEMQPYEDTDVRWSIYRSFNRIKTGI